MNTINIIVFLERGKWWLSSQNIRILASWQRNCEKNAFFAFVSVNLKLFEVSFDSFGKT